MNTSAPLFGTSPPGVGGLSKKSKQKPRYWNEEEDALLRDAIQEHGTEGYHTWKEVAKHVPNRTYRECMQRWTKVLAPGLKKGKWSAEEDQLLVKLVKAQLETLGEGNGKRIVWNKVASGFKGRSCKQCRERWINHLDPSVKKSEWTQEEDHALMQLFDTMPNKWAKIARQIPGRTENMVKVRWNALNRQAKKRKQNSLYYAGRPDLAGMNGYINPMGPGFNGQNPANYNQFYINNSIQFSLNQNPNLGHNGMSMPPGTPGGEYDGPMDPRKNSLYFFQNAQGGSDFQNMHMGQFPQLPNINLNGATSNGDGSNVEAMYQNSNAEHMRKMSLALSSMQSQYQVQRMKNESQQEQQGKNSAQDPRKDSLCLKENFSDEIFKGDGSGFPRNGSLAQLQKIGANQGVDGDRRLSFTINGFNFDEQSPNAPEGDPSNNGNGRRYSSLVYQNLLHMNSNGEQEQHSEPNSKRSRVSGEDDGDDKKSDNN